MRKKKHKTRKNRQNFLALLKNGLYKHSLCMSFPFIGLALCSLRSKNYRTLLNMKVHWLILQFCVVFLFSFVQQKVTYEKSHKT